MFKKMGETFMGLECYLKKLTKLKLEEKNKTKIVNPINPAQPKENWLQLSQFDIFS